MAGRSPLDVPQLLKHLSPPTEGKSLQDERQLHWRAHLFTVGRILRGDPQHLKLFLPINYLMVRIRTVEIDYRNFLQMAANLNRRFQDNKLPILKRHTLLMHAPEVYQKDLLMRETTLYPAGFLHIQTSVNQLYHLAEVCGGLRGLIQCPKVSVVIPKDRLAHKVFLHHSHLALLQFHRLPYLLQHRQRRAPNHLKKWEFPIQSMKVNV